jgi:tetratricopeptide (TPR) repeat protein
VPAGHTTKVNKPFHRPLLLLIAAAILLGGAWVWHLCRHDGGIPFLPADSAAEWIIYPRPQDTARHSAVPFWATFHRSFNLAAVPATATLSARAFREGEVRINGRRVAEAGLQQAQDWKRRHTSEVAKLLRAGTNVISVVVTNAQGPPALWLWLAAEGVALKSDSDWQVSLVGAQPQKAALASEPIVVRPGSPLYGRERMSDSLRRTWPVLLAILLTAAVGVGASRRFLRAGQPGAGDPSLGPEESGSPRSEATAGGRAAWMPVAVLVLIIVSWVVLFTNNLPQLAAVLGFDRDGHQQYIDFILQQKALPLANDGWQMYQPPLFYLLSAFVIGPFGWAASADPAVLMLRACSVLTGILHLLLIFQCLRLLFPNRPRQQTVGLLLAGFLPMSIVLSHHITNESLAALFVTASLYCSLRQLKGAKHAVAWAIAAGTCLGLALLTKFSALLAVPFVVVALVWPRGKSYAPGKALASASLCLLSLLAVCGWHFGRVWHRFGTPLIGNWDPRLPFAWWQDPGYHTSGWYWRFGEALICPLFSGINGFADGVYATLWGDGLCSGSALMDCRPQWNYDLMNAGYLLALLMTVLLATGAVVALIRFLRQPTPEWVLLLGVLFGFAAGIGLMTLRVASYAQVKAFYALPALVPLCAVAVVGWESLYRKSGVLRAMLWTGLLAWVVTVYSAFWIRSGNAYTYTVRGVGLVDDGRNAEAAENFTRALALDPHSLRARVGLAEALRRLGRSEEAREQAVLALKDHPEAAEALAENAVLLAFGRNYAEAVPLLLKAVTNAPDSPSVYQQLAACLAAAGQQREVIRACEAGLRVDPYNPILHQSLAVAAAETGAMTNAAAHLRLALSLKPKWPEARGLLAVALDSLGQSDQAAAEYEQAIRDKPADADLQYLYAMSLAMQGQTQAAVGHYRRALELKPDMVTALNNLAWILAANSDDRLRNGAEAVRLAQRACELTGNREPMLLGTLAAAYAEAGRFAEAVTTAEQARTLATAAGLRDVAEKNGELLKLYRSGKPCREPAAGPR